jgi:hypothetical protein
MGVAQMAYKFGYDFFATPPELNNLACFIWQASLIPRVPHLS